jgi:hypothetical protein
MAATRFRQRAGAPVYSEDDIRARAARLAHDLRAWLADNTTTSELFSFQFDRDCPRYGSMVSAEQSEETLAARRRAELLNKKVWVHSRPELDESTGKRWLFNLNALVGYLRSDHDLKAFVQRDEDIIIDFE